MADVPSLAASTRAPSPLGGGRPRAAPVERRPLIPRAEPRAVNRPLGRSLPRASLALHTPRCRPCLGPSVAAPALRAARHWIILGGGYARRRLAFAWSHASSGVRNVTCCSAPIVCIALCMVFGKKVNATDLKKRQWEKTSRLFYPFLTIRGETVPIIMPQMFWHTGKKNQHKNEDAQHIPPKNMA